MRAWSPKCANVDERPRTGHHGPVTAPQIHPDGWITVKAEGGETIHLKVGRTDPDPARRGASKVVLRSLLIEGDDITSDTLRQVQPARIVAALILDLLDSTAPEDAVPSAAKWLLEDETADDSATTLGDLRQRSASPVRAPKRRLLGRPDGSDTFYVRFAKAYASAAVESSKPAMALAAENDVPVETVRRWIKEARRRGHLPPATKGKAG